MGYTKTCSSCSHGCNGVPDSRSDWCDECQYEPDVGFGDFTDHSYKDEYGDPVHFYSQADADTFYNGHDYSKYPKVNVPSPKRSSIVIPSLRNFIDSIYVPTSMWG